MCLSHQEPIDLLVTEERTPETDGRRLARTLSRIRPQLKALFLSAPPPGIEAPLLQNTSPVLQQPFTAASLHAEVEAVLENGGPNH
jgi:DNA-binding response OmpR family regulator